jgi:4,5-dihydroxyphthalate decarboxylase
MPFTLAAPHEFAAQYIADGAVKVEGFDVTTDWGGGAVYRTGFTEPAYDFIVMPLSNWLIAMGKGMPLIGVPVFIDMCFPQLGIRVNRDAGIKTPKDLEGRRVGVRGLAFSPATWARGGLADLYDVQLDKIQWVVGEPNSLSGFDVPQHPGWSVEVGADLFGDLESGKLDATMWDRGGPRPTANTTYLFDDPLGEALKYYDHTAVFPVNTMLVAKRGTVEANPGLAQAVVDANDKARELYFKHASDSSDHMGLPVGWLRQHGMFPHLNGVANNHKALETIIRYTHEQGFIGSRPAVEDLFFAGAK